MLKYIKMIFFMFLKIIFKIAHQNNSKHTKKLIFNKKKLIFLKTRVQPRFQTLTLCYMIMLFLHEWNPNTTTLFNINI
jgi:hypothetical protein